MLNFLFLGRAMLKGLRLRTPAFQRDGEAERSSTPPASYYDGNSQGGIIGGALTAVAPDLDRASSASRG